MPGLYRLLGQIALCLGVLVLTPLSARGDAPNAWANHDPDGQTRVHLYFFWSLQCPHCLAARPEVEAMAQSQPWIVLHSLELT